jgi:hypothetical protein
VGFWAECQEGEVLFRFVLSLLFECGTIHDVESLGTTFVSGMTGRPLS